MYAAEKLLKMYVATAAVFLTYESWPATYVASTEPDQILDIDMVKTVHS